LPSDLGVTWAINISTDSSLMGGCGAAIFKLSSGTKDRIEKAGVDFFKNSLQARKSQESLYRYEEWKETPLPDSWTSEGMWLGLSCSEANKELISTIISAAKMKGSYYSIKTDGLILVVPNKDLVVYTYFD
jgi:hypothetical protein